MPKLLRLSLLSIGFLPYLVKLPYMFHAWRSSPQDNLDWIFILLFAFLFPAVSLRNNKCKPIARPDYYALFLLVPALLGYGLFLHARINAAQIASGIAIAFAVLWLLGGGRNAYRLLPAFGILALGTTSSTYWISYFVSGFPLSVSGFAIKTIAAIILLLWLVLSHFRPKTIRPGTLLFTAAAGVALLFVWQSNRMGMQKDAPVILTLSEGRMGDYLSRRQEPTADDIRFFGADSRIEKYYYVSDTEGFHILALTCGENVNSIHPASHCLRTSGWTIHFENTTATEIAGKAFHVNEIVAERDNATVLLWVWYANERFSTGSFLHFRRAWNREDAWHTYQVMTSLRNSTPESRTAARLRMQAFLQLLAAPKN